MAHGTTSVPAPQAWSLTAVVHPSGVREEVSYERDKLYDQRAAFGDGLWGASPNLLYAIAREKNRLFSGNDLSYREYRFLEVGEPGPGGGSNSIRGVYQGGTRVKSVKRTDQTVPTGLAARMKETEYEYGGGYASGLPDRYFMRRVGASNYFHNGSGGGSDVYYTWIKSTEAHPTGMTETWRHYLTSGSEVIIGTDEGEVGRVARPDLSILWAWTADPSLVYPKHLSVIRNNRALEWGTLHKVEVVEDTGDDSVPGPYRRRTEELMHTYAGPDGYYFRRLSAPLHRELGLVWTYANSLRRKRVTEDRYSKGRKVVEQVYTVDRRTGLVTAVTEAPLTRRFPRVEATTYAYELADSQDLNAVERAPYAAAKAKNVLTAPALVRTLDLIPSDGAAGGGTGGGETWVYNPSDGFFHAAQDSLMALAESEGEAAEEEEGGGGLSTDLSFCDGFAPQSEPISTFIEEAGCDRGADPETGDFCEDPPPPPPVTGPGPGPGPGNDDDDGGSTEEDEVPSPGGEWAGYTPSCYHTGTFNSGPADDNPEIVGRLYSANVTTYAEFGDAAPVARRSYVWNAAEPSDGTPLFDAWGEGQSPSTLGTGHWELVQHIRQYDEHRRPVQVADAAGTEVVLEYGGPGDAQLLSASTLDGGSEMRVTMEYDEAGHLVGTTDPAGVRSGYTYDGAGRLAAVLNHSGHTLMEHAYFEGAPAEPRFVETATYARGSLLQNGSFEVLTKEPNWNGDDDLQRATSWVGYFPEGGNFEDYLDPTRSGEAPVHHVTGDMPGELVPAFGKRAALLRNQSPNTTRQTVTVEPGREYVLQAYFAGPGRGGLTIKSDGLDMSAVDHAEWDYVQTAPHTFQVLYEQEAGDGGWRRRTVRFSTTQSAVLVGVMAMPESEHSVWVDGMALVPVDAWMGRGEALDAGGTAVSVTYVDGYGRGLAAAEAERSFADGFRIAHAEKDAAGRTVRAWLPIPSQAPGPRAAYVPISEASVQDAARAYYSGTGEGADAFGIPYAETVYDEVVSTDGATTCPVGVAAGAPGERPGECSRIERKWLRTSIQPGLHGSLLEETTTDGAGTQTVQLFDGNGALYQTKRRAKIRASIQNLPNVGSIETHQSFDIRRPVGEQWITRRPVISEDDACVGGPDTWVPCREFEAPLTLTGRLKGWANAEHGRKSLAMAWVAEQSDDGTWRRIASAMEHIYRFPDIEAMADTSKIDEPFDMVEGRTYRFYSSSWTTAVDSVTFAEANVRPVFNDGQVNADGMVSIEVPILTRFENDWAGRPLRVLPPNYFTPPEDQDPSTDHEGWATTYTRDMLGRVLRTETPDAAPAEFAYDPAGRLRLAKRPDHAAGALAATTYDWAGRPVAVAEHRSVQASFDELRDELRTHPDGARAVLGFEQAANSRTTLTAAYAYDGLPDFALYPWTKAPPAFADSVGFDWSYGGTQRTGQAGTLGRLEGRLAVSAHRDLTSHSTWRFEAVAYDEAGRAHRRYVADERALPGLVHSFAYAYTAAGALTQERVDAAGHHLTHRYVLDGRGRTVRAEAEAGHVDPASGETTAETVPVGTWAYHPVTGALAERRTGAVPGHAGRRTWRTYDARGRLVGIGDVDGPDEIEGAEPYAAAYAYDAAGRIRRWEQLTPHAVQASPYAGGAPAEHAAAEARWHYALAYDGLGRLEQAVYGTPGAACAGGAACSDAYSVGDLAYDANSNLTRLVRWGPALFAGGDGAVRNGRGAWADALTYRYAEGTNRLARVDEYEDPALDGTPSENPSGHEHSAGYAGRFDYDAAGRVTRERSGQSGPAVRRQVKRYSAASLPVRLDVPAAADAVHGGVRLEYRYDGAGQRVQEVVQARLGVDKGDPDPHYQKRVWLRHGDGRAAGVLDGDGRLVSWSLYGAGLAGRIEPGQDTPPDVGEATERAAADSAQAALGRYAVEGALAEANQVHALGLSEAEVKQAAAGAVQAAEAETRAAAEGSVSMAALASHDEIGGAYVAGAEAPLREALYGELVGLGVPEAAALTAATEAAKGAAAEGGTAAGLAVKPGGVAGYRWRYYHADHLGSVRAVTDGYGRVVEATDYYVFGLQMPGRVWRSDSETREG